MPRRDHNPWHGRCGTSSHARHPVLTHSAHSHTLPHLCFKIEAKEATVMGCCRGSPRLRVACTSQKKKVRHFATRHITKMWRNRRGRGSSLPWLGRWHPRRLPLMPVFQKSKPKRRMRAVAIVYAIDLESPRFQLILRAQHLFHGCRNATKSSLSRHRDPCSIGSFKNTENVASEAKRI